MESLLSFEKPKKVKSTENHNETYQSDSGVAGTYVPNMSKADTLKWKAKHIQGADERIEIRKTLEGVQLLVVVYKKENPVEYSHGDVKAWHKRHQNVRMSMNGKLDMTWENWWDLQEAVKEAFEILL